MKLTAGTLLNHDWNVLRVVVFWSNKQPSTPNPHQHKCEIVLLSLWSGTVCNYATLCQRLAGLNCCGYADFIWDSFCFLRAEMLSGG